MDFSKIICLQTGERQRQKGKFKSPEVVPARVMKLHREEYLPGLISSNFSLESSGGCKRLFLRQQRAGYV